MLDTVEAINKSFINVHSKIIKVVNSAVLEVGGSRTDEKFINYVIEGVNKLKEEEPNELNKLSYTLYVTEFEKFKEINKVLKK